MKNHKLKYQSVIRVMGWVIILGLLTGLGAMLAYRITVSPKIVSSDHPMIGRLAPSTPGSIFDSKIQDVRQSYGVHFFATWCGPCRQEWPILMTLQQQGMVIIGVAYHDDPTALKQWLEEQGNPFVKVIDDQTGEWAVPWGVRGVPETFIMDQSHRIIAHWSGDLSLLLEKGR